MKNVCRANEARRYAVIIELEGLNKARDCGATKSSWEEIKSQCKGVCSRRVRCEKANRSGAFRLEDQQEAPVIQLVRDRVSLLVEDAGDSAEEFCRAQEEAVCDECAIGLPTA